MSNSPFFTTLPTEVRDIIYNYLWSGTKTIVQRYDTKDYKVTYDRRHDSVEASSAVDKIPWLLTNKQMMREGIRQLHQKSTWHLDNRILDTHPQSYVLDAITPAECHTHEIFIRCDWPMIFDDVKRVYRLSEVARAEINRSAATANSSTPLDTVCIKLVRPTNERLAANSAADFSFNLSGLEILSSHTELRRLQVHLVGVVDDTKNLVWYWSLRGETDSANKARRLEDHYLDAWKKELSRAAELVIPGGKRSGYMREYTQGNGRCMEWVWTFEKQKSNH